MEEKKPIFDFAPLRKLLLEKGIHVPKSQTYQAVRQRILTTIDVISGKLKIEDDENKFGIIYEDPDSHEKNVGFMFKYQFHISGYANSKPKFHICNCETIKQFKVQNRYHTEYTFANTHDVTALDLDAHRNSVDYDELELCGYCRHILGKHGLSFKTTTDYINYIKDYVYSYDNDEAEQDYHYDAYEAKQDLRERLDLSLTKPEDVDINGYSADWEKISKEYRATHQYICENCGLQINEPFDRRFIHTHHINGNKTDNRDDNLECLCIKCHSDVDNRHRRNFSRGDKKRQLDIFMQKYQYWFKNLHNVPSVMGPDKFI